MENQPPNQDNINQQFNQQFGRQGQQSLPNSTAVLVLGIISIVGCFCYGIIGVVTGIIALVLSSKDTTLYQQNPSLYSEISYKNLKAGKVCAIVGLSLSAFYIICLIVYIAIIGAAFTALPWNMIR
jgi:hypothetical protein